MSPSAIFAITGALLLAGTFTNKMLSQTRINMPTLLLFLAVGSIVEHALPWVNGSECAEEINFFSLIAMSFILFSGGLETSFRNVHCVLKHGILLAIVGVLLTALFLGCGAYFILNRSYSFAWCILLGSLISSTDAAAVFAILRGKGIGLKGDLQPLLELESGSNDPMAAFLTIFMISMVKDHATLSLVDVPLLAYRMGGGVAFGVGCGLLGRLIFRIKQEHEGLYFVVCVALVLLGYGVAELLHTNGFMAVYACGVAMGYRAFYYKKAITKFSNGMAWLMQVSLFMVLGFLANPAEMLEKKLCLEGIALSVFLMFVARPAAVFICLAFSRFNWREKLLISWVGLRGAAPITLATFPLAANIANADMMFNLIFFMVMLSLLLQGSTLMPLARLLKLDRPENEREPVPLELERTHGSRNSDMLEFEVPGNAFFAGKTLAEMGLPKGALVTMIRRNGKFFAPQGDTRIEAGDGLLIMAKRNVMKNVIQDFFPESDQELESF